MTTLETRKGQNLASGGRITHACVYTVEGRRCTTKVYACYIFTWSLIGFVGHTESFKYYEVHMVHVVGTCLPVHVDSPPLLSVPNSKFSKRFLENVGVLQIHG